MQDPEHPDPIEPVTGQLSDWTVRLAAVERAPAAVLEAALNDDDEEVRRFAQQRLDSLNLEDS